MELYRDLGHLGVFVACTLATVLATAGRVRGQIPAVKVVVAEARTLEASSTATFVGIVEPQRRSRVSSEIAGLVAAMPGREGDFVRAGETVCRLNDDIHRLRVAEEEAELSALNARHDELLAGTRKEELARLKALLDEAAAVLEQWKFEMQRVERLYAGHESNEKEFRDTQAAFLAAQSRQLAAQADHELGVAGPRKELIAHAAHAAAQQRAVVAQATTDLQKTTIAAPFTGYIVERFVEVGEWVSAGAPIVEIIELESVLVRVDVAEWALPFLRVGDSVRVQIDALKRTLTGKIKHILRQADADAHTFPVKIEVENQDHVLAAGMFARATVPSGPTQTVVAVPKDAVFERDGVDYVPLVVPAAQGGYAGVLTPVTLGADVGEWIAVTSNNISARTRVITRGTERIMPFPTPVEIVDELGTPVAMPDQPQPVSERDGA